MKKITLYTISKCPLNSTEEEFINNICTVVSNKKHVGEYLINKVIIENWSHYSRWLELHEKQDVSLTRKEYIQTVLNGAEEFRKYTVKKQIYTDNGIAAILRMTNRCIPVGCSYESAIEIETLARYYDEVLDSLKKVLDTEEKE